MLLHALQIRDLFSDAIQLPLAVAPSSESGQHAVRDQQRQREHNDAADDHAAFPRRHPERSHFTPRAAIESPAVWKTIENELRDRPFSR